MSGGRRAGIFAGGRGVHPAPRAAVTVGRRPTGAASTRDLRHTA